MKKFENFVEWIILNDINPVSDKWFLNGVYLTFDELYEAYKVEDCKSDLTLKLDSYVEEFVKWIIAENVEPLTESGVSKWMVDDTGDCFIINKLYNFYLTDNRIGQSYYRSKI